MNQQTAIIAAGAGLGLLALVALRGLQTGAAKDLGAGVAKAVADAGAGVVVGIGDVVGVPETDVTACQRAKAARDVWGASFACPAGEFLSWVARGTPAEG